MPFSRAARGQATLGGVVLEDLFAKHGFETPAYVYDLDGMAASARVLREAFASTPHLVAYAIKANSAGPIVSALREAGCGAEIVSGGELAVALGAGVSPEAVLWSGVAKLDWEIDAALKAGDRGILAIQVESVEELPRIDARAEKIGRRARVSIRVNPGVEADTHAHVATGHDEAKFGVALEDLADARAALAHLENLELVGLSCHIGSQLTSTAEYAAAARELIRLAKSEIAGSAPLDFIDFGGGFGVDYGSGCASAPADFARAMTELIRSSDANVRRIVVEPGRSLVAAHAVLCARVVMVKRSKTGRRWLMIDAGMNDLIRPALYAARHRIERLDRPTPSEAIGYRVVGPVCESSDDFGEHAFSFDDGEGEGLRVAIRDAGAYGFTMASEYNGRALPTEIFLRGGAVASVSPSPGVDEWVKRRLEGVR